MIRSEILLRMRFSSQFQNESYIPQLFTRKFSPREPKCLNGVEFRDSDGHCLLRIVFQVIFRTNQKYMIRSENDLKNACVRVFK